MTVTPCNAFTPVFVDIFISLNRCLWGAFFFFTGDAPIRYTRSGSGPILTFLSGSVNAVQASVQKYTFFLSVIIKFSLSSISYINSVTVGLQFFHKMIHSVKFTDFKFGKRRTLGWVVGISRYTDLRYRSRYWQRKCQIGASLLFTPNKVENLFGLFAILLWTLSGYIVCVS